MLGCTSNILRVVTNPLDSASKSCCGVIKGGQGSGFQTHVLGGKVKEQSRGRSSRKGFTLFPPLESYPTRGDTHIFSLLHSRAAREVVATCPQSPHTYPHDPGSSSGGPLCSLTSSRAPSLLVEEESPYLYIRVWCRSSPKSLTVASKFDLRPYQVQSSSIDTKDIRGKC